MKKYTTIAVLVAAIALGGLSGCAQTFDGLITDAGSLGKTIANSAANVGGTALNGAANFVNNAANDVTYSTHSVLKRMPPFYY